MQKSVLIALFIALAGGNAQAAPEWSGSANWRYLIRHNDDGLNTMVNGRSSSESTAKAHQLRANIGASEKGEVWDWGVGLRTGGTSATSDWVSLRNNADQAINLESAYVRAHREILDGKGAIVLGRAKSVILFDSYGQALFDKDNRFDGLGWSWQKDEFGLNLSQYVLGARNSGAFGASSFSRTEATEAVASTQSGFAMLYSVQPHYTFRISDDIQTLVAVAYHHWTGTGGTNFENAVHGGTAGTVGNTNPVIVDNPRQWHFLTDWTLPWSLRFVGEYVQNKKTFYGSRGAGGLTDKKAQAGALALTLAYGKVKKANDWALSYSYVQKGIASSVNAFSNSNMPADNIGHMVNGAFALADGLSVGAKVELYREKAKLGGDGLALAAPNQNRKQSQDRFEFYTTLSF